VNSVVESILAADLSADVVRAIAELRFETWPQGASVERRIERMNAAARQPCPDPAQASRYFLVRRRGEILAAAHFIPRTVSSEYWRATVLGLAGVCVAAEHRGRGYGAAMVLAAFELVDADIFPFALFQTTPEVRPFYERLGAILARNRFTNSLAEDPDSPPFHESVVMRYPSGGDWPSGEIDVHGQGW